jgi:hypothetical protein
MPLHEPHLAAAGMQLLELLLIEQGPWANLYLQATADEIVLCCLYIYFPHRE